jgi:hypothetical protein
MINDYHRPDQQHRFGDIGDGQHGQGAEQLQL